MTITGKGPNPHLPLPTERVEDVTHLVEDEIIIRRSQDGDTMLSFVENRARQWEETDRLAEHIHHLFEGAHRPWGTP